MNTAASHPAFETMTSSEQRARANWSRYRTGLLALALLAASVLAGYFVLAQLFGGDGPARSAFALNDIPFNGTQAYEYLKQLCGFGSRPSGSAAMAGQQKFLIEYFQKLGATVVPQAFRARHPLTGEPVLMTNLIVQWHPERKERVLLVAHYDTRPFPDRDAKNPRGTFVGANDGASGVAILMELGKSMRKFQSRYGVDFLLTDGEELVFGEVGTYCLGAEHFAKNYFAEPPPYRYRWGVLLDMVGGAHLQLLQERYSVDWKDTKPLVDDIWGTAKCLGVKEFLSRARAQAITDDHVALRNIGGIPTCDLLDMEYPQWHTEADDPAHCSPLSLAKVGWVIEEWLKSLK